MVTSCAVAGCNNNAKKPKKVHFFTFPKDADLRATWVAQCHRSGKFNPKTSRVCSEHFTDSDFENLMEVKFIPNRKLFLKKDAIPTRKLIVSDENLPMEDLKLSVLINAVEDIPVLNFTRGNSGKKQKIVKNYIDKQDQTEFQLQPSTSKCVDENKVISQVGETKKLQQQIEQMKKEIDSLRKENNDLVLESEKNKKQLSILERELHSSITTKNIKTKRKNIDEQIQEILSKIFTDTQIQLLLKREKRIRWSEKDLSVAFTIRYYSRHCYVFLRQKLHYPLPGLTVLRKWAQKILLKKGILTGILNLLQVAGVEMSKIEKLVVLQYKEIKLKENYEYDPEADVVLGPYKYLQIVNARSLCGKWNQPIFAEFDKEVTPEILKDLVTRLHNIGFRVVGCVSDCEPKNTGLWAALGISWHKPWIQHPCIDKKIYFFVDTLHTLKLIRNWLLDGGFILKNGFEITKEPLLNLITSSEDLEDDAIYKINQKHLVCQGSQRQDILLATQLMSHTVACILSNYNNEDMEYAYLSEFIDTVNDWFDIMNSRVPTAPIATKSGYGTSEIKTEQDNCLNKAMDIILHMRCMNKTKIQKFQEGILLSIKSLQLLFDDLHEEYNLKYILTHKLNHEPLENLFSQLSCEGDLNDHPSPLKALNRFRLIMLGKFGIGEGKTGASDTSEEEYILGKVLKRTGVEINTSNFERCQDSDSTSSTISSDSLPIPDEHTKVENEEDRLQYLAGWIAIKLKSSNLDIGSSTHKEMEEHSYSLPSCVKHLFMFGGSKERSEEFLQEIRLLDALFCKYSQTTFTNVKDIKKKLITKISKHSNADPIVIETFVEQRILIRIKFLNVQINQGKIKYGKRLHDDPKTENNLKRMKS